ncbi:MAG: glycosyltransferase [Gammaproteobacteria bacterium]|nr:glycosyltransferase [Gammaproteobacteria bacterium]
MKFSIIIPTFNEENTIVSCLKALQAYHSKDCELIVADGGSSDNTIALARPLADRLVISGKGRALQMNAGAAQASGDILLFLHADTTLPENAFILIEHAINDRQQWGRFDVELMGSHPLLKIVAWCMNFRSRWTGIATGDQAIFINKSLFESVGQYPVIALMEDIALCKKLKQICSPVCLKAKAMTSGRRWERGGVLRTILLMWCLRLRYFLGTDPQILAADYYKDTDG